MKRANLITSKRRGNSPIDKHELRVDHGKRAAARMRRRGSGSSRERRLEGRERRGAVVGGHRRPTSALHEVVDEAVALADRVVRGREQAGHAGHGRATGLMLVLVQRELQVVAALVVVVAQAGHGALDHEASGAARRPTRHIPARRGRHEQYLIAAATQLIIRSDYHVTLIIAAARLLLLLLQQRW